MKTIENRGRKAFEIPAHIKPNWKQKNELVAKQIGCSTSTVINLRKRMGIPAMPTGRPVEQMAVAARPYKDTLSQVRALRETVNNLYKTLSKGLVA
jgi:hypothetical protein